jgi:hypothetical protein
MHIKRIEENFSFSNPDGMFLSYMVNNKKFSVIIKDVKGAFPYKNNEFVENFMDFAKALANARTSLKGNLEISCYENLFYNAYVYGYDGELIVDFYIIYHDDDASDALNDLIYELE